MANYGNYYNADVSSAFSADVNMLPTLRSAIETEFSNDGWDKREAAVVSVSMKSATEFSVSFNRDNYMTAELLASGEYGVEFAGTVAKIEFAAQTTLTYLRLEWFNDVKNHSKITLSPTPSTGVTIAVKDDYGNVFTPSADGTYDLIPGMYRYTASHADYNDKTDVFFVSGIIDETVAVTFDAPVQYTITFALTPATASVVVKDSGGTVVAPQSAGVYLLSDSTAAGTYTYTVTADDYSPATGTLDVQADATETVTLDALVLASIAITTPPTTTEYTVGDLFDDAGMVVTATFTDNSTATVTGYTWTPDTELATTDVSVTVSYTYSSVTKTETQAITVTE